MAPLRLAPNLRIVDSLYNFISGLGGARDKAVSSIYQFVPMQVDQLNNAYRADWVARKVIDCPAQDSTRAWRQWQAENPQIETLETVERMHNIQNKLRQALVRARLYGGAALIMGVDVGNSEEELDLKKVGKDRLKFIHVVSRYELSCGQLITDVDSPWYGEPSYYMRNSSVGSLSDQVKIHPSRVVRLIGADLPDINLTGSDGGWGDPVLQIVDDAIRALGGVSGGIASMVQEAKIDVIKIPGMSKNISTQEYKDKLSDRFNYANTTKSILNTLVLDKEEEWSRTSTQFGTLPDILKMYLLIASGAADIPATRMLGQSPTGLSATGDSDTRNYYDRISSEQSTQLQPALARLDDVLIASALGTRDPDVFYNWHPLWQMTELEKATLAKQKADAHKVDVDTGLISAQALRIGRENQLIEDGTYPGFEGALEDAEAMDDLATPNQVEKPPPPPMLAPPRGGSSPTGTGSAIPEPKLLTTDAAWRRRLRRPFELADFNPYHEPGGSSEGGRFASAGSGGGGGSAPSKKTVKAAAAKVTRAAKQIGVEMTLVTFGADSIYLERIDRTMGKPGAGAKALGMLVEMADEHGIELSLNAEHNAPKLFELYERLGFKAEGSKTAGPDVLMVRPAKRRAVKDVKAMDNSTDQVWFKEPDEHSSTAEWERFLALLIRCADQAEDVATLREYKKRIELADAVLAQREDEEELPL